MTDTLTEALEKHPILRERLAALAQASATVLSQRMMGVDTTDEERILRARSLNLASASNAEISRALEARIYAAISRLSSILLGVT